MLAHIFLRSLNVVCFHLRP